MEKERFVQRMALLMLAIGIVVERMDEAVKPCRMAGEYTYTRHFNWRFIRIGA